MSRFINTEIKSDSESSDSGLDLKKGQELTNELMAKLGKSGSDNDSE